MQTALALPPSRILESQYTAIKECRHGVFMYNVNDMEVGRSLDLYGEWRDDEVFVLEQLVREGDFVIDVGANLGTHSIPLARRLGENGAVIALEPQRVAYQMLCGNAALNGLSNVICLRATAGADVGSSSFSTIDPKAAHSLGNTRPTTFGAVESVDTTTIDSFELPGCALIRIAIGGVAHEVIAGAKNTITQYRPVLFVRGAESSDCREVFEAMSTFGYKAYWQIANAFNPGNYFGNQENALTGLEPSVNLVIVPEECSFDGLVPVDGPEDNWRKAATRSGRAPSQTVSAL